MRETITVFVDSRTLEQARSRAALGDTPLTTLVGEVVQTWLEAYLAQPMPSHDGGMPTNVLNHVDVGRHFSRDELNER